jgi:hypothetical protein
VIKRLVIIIVSIVILIGIAGIFFVLEAELRQGI